MLAQPAVRLAMTQRRIIAAVSAFASAPAATAASAPASTPTPAFTAAAAPAFAAPAFTAAAASPPATRYLSKRALAVRALACIAVIFARCRRVVPVIRELASAGSISCRRLHTSVNPIASTSASAARCVCGAPLQEDRHHPARAAGCRCCGVHAPDGMRNGIEDGEPPWQSGPMGQRRAPASAATNTSVARHV